MLELTIVGNVGFCRLHTLPSTSLLIVSLASNRRVEGKDYADWVTLKIWGERALKLADHISTGQRLLARGRPEVRLYQRSEDSVCEPEWCLHVARLEFLGRKPVPLVKEEPASPRRKRRKALEAAK